MKKLFITILIFITITPTVFSQLRMPAFFSDSMVLQQNTNAPIWGWASPGEKIFVTGSWSNKTVQTIATSNGKWMTRLPTPKAGGPYVVTIKAGETKQLKGVMIGEVWICSGQSNMEMPVSGWPSAPIKNSSEEIGNAHYPSIRLFTVERKIAFSPQEDVQGSWASCNPQSVRNFSATAYFFGRELYNHLKVPIGLISTNWGGTVAEAWTSEPSLISMEEFTQEIDAVNAMPANLKSILKNDSLNSIAWQKALKENHNEYADRLTDIDWHTMALPASWESNGLQIDGIVWFKRIVNIPESWAGKTLKLSLGPVDDNDVTFLNGKAIDSSMQEGLWNTDRHYTIPANLFKAGNNMLAVKVIDNGGKGGINGNKEKLKLYPDGGNDTISLAGDWYYKVQAIKPAMGAATNPNQPTVLYNGMIAPLIPFAIKGVIWYQGESNVGRAKQYTKLFPLMISDWRKHWEEGDFPFYFVQIAPFQNNGDSTLSAELRDAQRRTLTTTTNTGMAVTMDIGDNENIHPADKQDVGKRLSLWALNKIYGKKNIVYSGPLYKSFEIKGNKIIVSFSHTEGGLSSHGKPLRGFELQDADGIWKPATAVIEGNKIIVTSRLVDKPTGVRYAFYSYATGSLFNGNGLPASSFTTGALQH